MIERTQYLETIRERLQRFPVVSVLGPRQVGKTTLAQVIAGEQPSHFFDLEDVDAQTRLAEPKAALERLTGLVVLDEVQRKPELFALLRVLADTACCGQRRLPIWRRIRNWAHRGRALRSNRRCNSPATATPTSGPHTAARNWI